MFSGYLRRVTGVKEQVKDAAVDLDSPAHRRCASTRTLVVTTGTATAPEHYERHLLPRYQRGQLGLTQAADLLAVSVDHVRRRTVGALVQRKLQVLLATSLRSILT